jgi:hypothetical protein
MEDKKYGMAKRLKTCACMPNWAAFVSPGPDLNGLAMPTILAAHFLDKEILD